MSSVFPIALSGLRAAQSGLHVHAHNIANQQTPGFTRQLPSPATQASGGVSVRLQSAEQPGADLAADSVGLIQSRHAFAANLAVLKAGDERLGRLLDLHA